MFVCRNDVREALVPDGLAQETTIKKTPVLWGRCFLKGNIRFDSGSEH